MCIICNATSFTEDLDRSATYNLILNLTWIVRRFEDLKNKILSIAGIMQLWHE
jgi:hypothetical protein